MAREENIRDAAAGCLFMFFIIVIPLCLYFYDEWKEKRDAYYRCVAQQLELQAHPVVARAICANRNEWERFLGKRYE